MFPRILTAGGLSAILWFSYFRGEAAPVAEAVPSEVNAIRRQLDELQTRHAALRMAAVQQFRGRLTTAAASPQAAAAAYVGAVEIAQFGGRPITRFVDWKKDNSAILAHPALRAAALLHLKYLGLTLDRCSRPDGPPDLGALRSYLLEAIDTRQLIERTDVTKFGKNERMPFQEQIQALFNRPVDKGVFAEAYGLAPLFEDLKGWEMSPGNLAGILNSTVRPTLRENLDPELLETWDLQIEFERALVGGDAAKDPGSTWNMVRLPTLRWSRAEDQIALGDESGGYRSMMALITAYPGHPDNLRWIEALSREIDQTHPEAPTAKENPASSGT